MKNAHQYKTRKIRIAGAEPAIVQYSAELDSVLRSPSADERQTKSVFSPRATYGEVGNDGIEPPTFCL